MSFLFLALGFVCLILGSHFLVKSLKDISLYYQLKPVFLSIVVLGFVSSSPEYFVTIMAGWRNLPDAALGNILGSNVINILLVLGFTGLFFRFSYRPQILHFDIPVLISAIFLLGLFSLDQSVSPLEGLLMLGAFFTYLVFLFKKRKSVSNNEEFSPSEDFVLLKSFSLLFLGFVVLFLGSSLAVEASLSIVEAFSLSERFAGVFILSLSTSLPELATVFQAAYKKEGEMALGSIVGSNIFNTLFVLGSASLLNHLYFSKELYHDYFFMLFVTGVLWLSLLFFKNIPKVIFAAFVLSYFVYIVFVSETWI